MKYLPLTCSDRLLDVFNIVFVTEFLRHSSIEVLDLDDDGNCGVLFFTTPNIEFATLFLTGTFCSTDNEPFSDMGRPET
uniref:RRM domain-containing protein n=1 Tax=Schistosoma curassoni TaxID=6186 RepID=A0A183KNA6_9TREM